MVLSYNSLLHVIINQSIEYRKSEFICYLYGKTTLIFLDEKWFEWADSNFICIT